MKRNTIPILTALLLSAVLASSAVLLAQALRPRHDPSMMELKVGAAFSVNELTLFMEKNAKGWTQIISHPGYTELTSSRYPVDGIDFDVVRVKLTRSEQIAEILNTQYLTEARAVDEFYEKLRSRLTMRYGKPTESDALSVFWEQDGVFLTKIPAGVSLKLYSPKLLIRIEQDAGIEN